ncbi:MAG: ABC transporter substrate-binding protein [Gammaproteobacteria bacterium]|nr:ABC transporter substrate-binding protein [Gammaproteobacteria bacterium]
MPISNNRSPLRCAGVPEHFNLPWRELAETDTTNTIAYREYRGGTGAMVKALADDEVDVAILLTEGALTSIASGGQHRIVKVYVDTPLEWGIHVAADSSITEIEQIRGSRYAISRSGSGSHIMAAVHAADSGWPIDQLDFVKVRNLEGARRALPAGDADIFFWEKTMTQPCVDRAEFRRITTFQSPWPSFVICASDYVIAHRRTALRQLLERINALTRSFMSDCDGALAVAQTYDLALPIVERWFNKTRWNTGFKLSAQTFSQVLDVLDKLALGVDRTAKIENMLHRL